MTDKLERVVITGGYGCIGVWAATFLADQGTEVVIADVSTDDHRLQTLVKAGICGPDALGRIRHQPCDLTKPDDVDAVLAKASAVIHLGALQVPFCRADPRAGAAVNVGGTINVFESALKRGVERVVYASSIAVYGPMTAELGGPKALVNDSTPHGPTTLYGGYKVANELNAQVYAAEHGLGTIGLRPHTLYGPGRDQGLTSQPTQAIAAALRGLPFHIEYSGAMGFQYAPDVARWFIAAAAADPKSTADVYNLGGSIAPVAEFIEAITAAIPDASVTCENEVLAFPIGCDDSSLRTRLGNLTETSLVDGVAETARILEAAS